MTNKNNTEENNEIFKVKGDGTIVWVDETNSTVKPKKKKWKKVVFWIISLIVLFIIGAISYVYYEEETRRKSGEEEAIRNAEERAYAENKSDFVYWTTIGSNTDIHFFQDCSIFSGRQVSEGTVRDAVKYFRNERGVTHYYENYDYYRGFCQTCVKRAREGK